MKQLQVFLKVYNVLAAVLQFQLIQAFAQIVVNMFSNVTNVSITKNQMSILTHRTCIFFFYKFRQSNTL